MARIRTIKPGFFQHETLSSLDAETQLLAAGLLCLSDDEGYFNANPKLVQAEIFPMRELSSTVPVMLRELSRVGWIRLGTGPENRTYGHVVKFKDHQVISHPTTSRISCLEISWSSPVVLHEVSALKGKEGNKERKGKEGGASAFTLPDWIDPDVWSEYERMRGRIKKPAGDFTRKRTIGDLTKLRACGHDANEILGRSIDGCWTGVFAPKNFNPKSNGKLNLDELYAEDENGSPELTRKT